MDEKEPCLHDSEVENCDASKIELNKNVDSKSYHIEVHTESAEEKQLCLDSSKSENCTVVEDLEIFDDAISNVEVVHIGEVEIINELTNESDVNQEQQELSDDSSKQEKNKTKKVGFS